MNRQIIMRWGIWFMVSFLCMGCFAQENDKINTERFHGIVNFGDPNAIRLKQRLLTLQAKPIEKQVVVITQFGDSHSAADFFTGALRQLMQERFGDAGIGWVSPMAVPGQYHTGVSWKTQNWQIFSSRNVHDRDYPMGGYIAQPAKNSGYLQVIPRQFSANEQWSVRMQVKPLKLNALQAFNANESRLSLRLPSQLNQWQSVNFITTMPFKIKAKNSAIELGSFWLQKCNQSGIILSSIATNGAKLSIWQKWTPQWFDELTATKSDLVILAYGTNESFESTLNLVDYRAVLKQNIANIRKQLPDAVILLLSSPDTMLVNTTPGQCSNRLPPNYQAIRKIQQDVAQSEKLLYWDWQTAMGGECIIEKWLMMDLAKPDLIHLTRPGYTASASILYQDLMAFIEN